MKTVLFINACVRKNKSRTLKIAYTYLNKLKQSQDINIISCDLSKEDIKFLTEKNFDEYGSTVLNHDCSLAKEFAKADEIVIAAPFWEFLFPALLAAYFEMVSIPNIAFEYTPTGSRGLCKANKITYIYTAGDILNEDDKLCEKYVMRLAKLYGIPKVEVFLAEGLDIETRNADEIVEKVCIEITNNT